MSASERQAAYFEVLKTRFPEVTGALDREKGRAVALYELAEAAAKWALEGETQDAPLAQTAAALERLTAQAAGLFVVKAKTDPSPDVTDEGGLVTAVEAHTAWLRRFAGDHAQSLGVPNAYRNAELSRLESWQTQRTQGGNPPWRNWEQRFADFLAIIAWRRLVRPQLEREASLRAAPGVVSPVVTSLVAVSRRGAQLDLLDPSKARILDRRGQVVGELTLKMGPTVDGRVVGLAALGTLAAQRVLRFALREGFENRYLRQAPNFAEVWVEGGWRALAERLGQTTGDAAQKLREAAFTLDALSVDGPLGIGRVFAVHEHRPAPGRQARIEMHLMGPLRPGYATDELRAHARAEDKRIVPVPLPSMLPPLVGRENEWAAQAQLQLLALRELRTHAEALAEHEGVEISDKRWRALGEEASLPAHLLGDVISAFVQGNDTSPAFLKRLPTGLFDLAPAYSVERDAILSAGQTAARGRQAGRRSAARRRRGAFGRGR